jgi:hypothetical protein
VAGRTQTVEDKLGQWLQAYKAIAEEVTPPALRERFNDILSLPLPDDPDNVITYTARMNTAMALARLVSANDRAAATVAALLTQSGIKPAAVDYGDEL